MKKITLWLFALFTCWQINAQVLTESFDAATFPPTGWTNVQTGGTGTGNIWTGVTAGTFPTIATHSGTGMTSFASFNYASGVQSSLSSSVIDLSVTGNYRVTFWMYRDNGYLANADKVDVYLNTAQNMTGATLLGTVNRSISLAPAVTANGWYQYSFVVPSTFNTAVNHLVFNATSAYGNNIFLDDIVVELIPAGAPACVAITSPANGAINISNPTFTWNANLDATGYKILVGTTPGGSDVANMDDLGNVTSFTVPEAEAGVTYFATVFPYNAGGDATGCTQSSFTTCDALPVPFLEGFNSTSATQSCWSVLNANGDGDAWNMDYATTPIEGDQSAAITTDFNGGANNDYLISPKITLNGNQRLIFKYKVQSAGEPNDFAVLLSTTGNAAADFTTVLSPLTSYSNIAAETKVIPLTAITGDVHIAWHVPAGGLDGWRLYIDEVIVEDIPVGPPACVTITSPVNGATNISNPTFTWNSNVDATGYKILVGTTAGGSDVANMDDLGNVTSYTILETEPGTTYYATVFAYNANGDSVGCTQSSFTTCDGFGNFSENLDALTATGQIPSCWSRVLSNGASIYATVGTATTNNSAPYSVSFYNSDSPSTANIMLVTPYINNIDAGTNRLRFFARNSAATEDIQVGTMSNPADASTFTVLQTVDLGTSFAEFSVSFSGYTGTDKYIAIRRLSTATYTYVYIDNIVWEAIPAVAPTCVAITSPTTGATNVMNSNITWASNADATGYKISVGTGAGLTNVLNLQDVGNVLSYSFPSDAGTTYYVTVFPYNAFGQPTTCTEISFTTCDSLTPDLLEQFDTFLPSCWANMFGGDLTTGPTTSIGSGWGADGFANAGTTGAIRNNIFMTGANDWVISPIIEIPATGYELKFDAAATQWNGTGAPTTPWEADDSIQVLVSTTGTSNWTALYTYDNTNQPSNTGTINVIDLDAYAGMNVRFAFRGVEGTADGGADIDFSIDNFQVRLTPALAPSCASNVVATPNPCGNFENSITWAATSGANGYRISIGTTTGGTDVANNVDLGNVLTYSFTGTVATTYYYTLIPYNGVGPATGCTEMSFATAATGCYCTSSPSATFFDGNGISNVNIVTTNFPNAAVPYTNNSATPVDMSQGILNNVQITFQTGYTYNTYILIDFNNDLDFTDAGELVFTGESSNQNPTVLDASFVMSSTAPLGQHRMRIVTADFLTTVDPCYSGNYGVTIDYTVNIVVASCSPPAATASIVPACTTAQYSIDVNVTNLGSGTPSITDGTTTWPVTALGVVNVGPFADAASVTLTLLHGSDTTCNLPLGVFTYTCPPANDNCTTAQVLTPGGVFADNSVVGTNVGATNSNETAPSCANYQGKEVWYSVTVPASGSITIESDTNPGTAITDTGLAVFSGSCGNLTQVGCNDDDGNGAFSKVSLTGRTAGEVLYVSVWEYGGDLSGTFKVSAYDASLSSDSFDNANFKAYPNPVKDILNLSYSSEISNVRVINLLGQEVVSRAINATSTQVDMSQLSAGAYIVNVTVGDTIKTIKIVKQ